MKITQYLTGQRVLVPDPNGGGTMIEVTVVASNTRTTHYQMNGRKGWTFTPRVKPLKETT